MIADFKLTGKKACCLLRRMFQRSKMKEQLEGSRPLFSTPAKIHICRRGIKPYQNVRIVMGGRTATRERLRSRPSSCSHFEFP